MAIKESLHRTYKTYTVQSWEKEKHGLKMLSYCGEPCVFRDALIRDSKPNTLQRHTIPKIQNRCSQKRNCAASVTIYRLDRIYGGGSQTHECENWDRGHAIPFLETHKWDFRCSALLSSSGDVPEWSANESFWRSARGWRGGNPAAAADLRLDLGKQFSWHCPFRDLGNRG